ncbi:hypothetical protein OF829_16525 [Sphingomonas sp. LB-2]|uniref:hypothetical protein n=1 Tax=Sphingomonas caeni TaxID=2984949 RepID=UPI0022318732|nr:hypothetical protein [Sphingomonas caeni]MCW3848843.1 hypothetical protein [Sphingomonas caeni]
MRGYVFQKGLDDLRRAFEATMATIHTAHENAQADWLADKKAIEAGVLEAGVYEDRDFLYDRETLHELLIEQSRAAIPIAINAYVVILHHFWEKAVDDWRMAKRGKNYDAKREYAWLESHGLAPDRAALEFLRKAANTIKHNNPELYVDHSHLFNMGNGSAARPDYAGGLRLADGDFLRLLDSVRASGLQITSRDPFPYEP